MPNQIKKPYNHSLCDAPTFFVPHKEANYLMLKMSFAPL